MKPIYTTDGARPRFWRDGGQWLCRVPPSGAGHEAIYAAWHGPDWWKTHGLIGRGATKKEALLDLRSWERAAAVVADIY